MLEVRVGEHVMNKFLVTSLGLSAVAAFAAPAAAAVSACPATFSASPGLIGCTYVSGNVLGGASGKVSDQEDAIESLLGLAAGSYTVDWATVDPTKSSFSYSGDPSTPSPTDGILTRTSPFFGKTVLGVHVGNSNSAIGNSTAFLLFDFSSPTTAINLTNGQGFSDAVLYQTSRVPAVPEPSAWALLILGFGVVGGALRSARKGRPALNYL